MLVAGPPAVPGGDVEVSVGTELELTAVVIVLRLREAQEPLFAVGIGDIRIARHLIARHHGEPRSVQRPLGVVHVEEAVACVAILW